MDNVAVQLHTPILEFFLGCSKFHEVKLEYTARSKLTQLSLPRTLGTPNEAESQYTSFKNGSNLFHSDRRSAFLEDIHRRSIPIDTCREIRILDKMVS